MSISDKLEQLKAAPVLDSMDKWLLSLSPEDRATMEANAASPRLTHSGFWQIAKSEGCPVGKAKFTEWRKRMGYGTLGQS